MLPWSFEKEKWEQCSLQQTLLCHPSFTQSTWPFHMHRPLLGTPSPLSMALYLREIRWHWVSNESSTAASSLSPWAVCRSAAAVALERRYCTEECNAYTDWQLNKLSRFYLKRRKHVMVLDRLNTLLLNVSIVAAVRFSSRSPPRTPSAQCDNHWCLIQLQVTTIIYC